MLCRSRRKHDESKTRVAEEERKLTTFEEDEIAPLMLFRGLCYVFRE